jgi:hypothetical protein
MKSIVCCMTAAGLVLALCCPPVMAMDLYATPQGEDSILLAARPGEYFYNLGADAVRHKDYAHAIEMYKVAASWAHKTSEYNLGVMYARGEGVAVDLPRAMAWMALAAERNDKQYVQARDLIASMLDKNGLAQAEVILQELLPTYGDAVALDHAKRRWREVRNEATGSHLGFTGNLSVGNAQHGEAGKSQLDPASREAEAKFLESGKEGGEGGRNASAGSKSVPAMGSANTGVQTAAGVLGTNSTDGAKVYSDLHVTDNPYDPRFDRGVATVGPLIPLDKKAAATDESKKNPAVQSNDQKDPDH